MKEALKLALEALEHLQPTALTSFYTIGDRDKAMTAIKEALAQPEQEPVAIYRAGQAKGEPFHVGFFKALDADEVLLYTAPPAAQPEQEPVATTYKEVTDAMNLLLNGDYKQVQMAQLMADAKLYTTPPQRPWVGLTEEEANLLWENTDDTDSWELIKKIEAKLKELNT